MQIIYKQHEEGYKCLYDTRSDKFFPNGGSKNKYLEQSLLDLANSVASKSNRQILEIANSYNVEDETEKLIASAYIDLNPDIKEKVFDKIVSKKGNYKGKRRGRKSKLDGEVKPKVVNLDENGAPRKRGRPRKIV
jgi:hypothetical protein